MSLAWPNHVHHQASTAWFQTRAAEPWATTPITELGFVRVSSNARILPHAVTPPEAAAMLERMCQVAAHRFLVDDVDSVVGTLMPPTRISTHTQVTDAHLLALARRHGARLATFDRGMATLADGRDLVLVPFS